MDAEDPALHAVLDGLHRQELRLLFERVVLLVDMHIDGFAELLGEAENDIEMRFVARIVARRKAAAIIRHRASLGILLIGGGIQNALKRLDANLESDPVGVTFLDFQRRA